MRWRLLSKDTTISEAEQLLSELEQAGELRSETLKRVHALVADAETFASLSTAGKCKLVELLIRNALTKRCDDDTLMQALAVIQTIVLTDEHTMISSVSQHVSTIVSEHVSTIVSEHVSTILEALVSLLSGCESVDVREKLLIVARDVLTRCKRESTTFRKLTEATSIRKLSDRLSETTNVCLHDAHAKVRRAATLLTCTLLRIGVSTNERDAFRAIMTSATDPDSAVRCVALHSLLLIVADRLDDSSADRLDGTLTGISSANGATYNDALSRLIDDWNVLYSLACAALDDDYDEVRNSALRCVSVFAYVAALRERDVQTVSNNDERTTRQRNRKSSDDRPSNNEEVSETRRNVLDDAFVRLCAAMADGAGAIRECAARLLGAFGRRVAFECVREAIEPRVMVDLRAERTMYRRQADRFRGAFDAATSNTKRGTTNQNARQHGTTTSRVNVTNRVDLTGWSTTATMQSGADHVALAYGDVDISDMPLTISARSANGALIAGLEDELAAVRNATIHTIVQLARMHLHTSVDDRATSLRCVVRLALTNVHDELCKEQADELDSELESDLDCLINEDAEFLTPQRNGH